MTNSILWIIFHEKLWFLNSESKLVAYEKNKKSQKYVFNHKKLVCSDLRSTWSFNEEDVVNL